jgi:hypothetical protein
VAFEVDPFIISPLPTLPRIPCFAGEVSPTFGPCPAPPEEEEEPEEPALECDKDDDDDDDEAATAS